MKIFRGVRRGPRTDRLNFGDYPMIPSPSLYEFVTPVMHFNGIAMCFLLVAALNCQGNKTQSSAEVYVLYRVLSGVVFCHI